MVTVANNGKAPLTIEAATLLEPAGAGSTAVVPRSTTVLAQAHAIVQGQTVTTSIDALVPHIGPVVLELDIWDTPKGLHYGSYGLEQPRVDAVRSFTLTLDLPSGGVHGVDEKGVALPVGATFEGLKPGDYAARLNIKGGTRLLATSGDLFTFTIDEQKQLLNIHSEEVPTLATAADRPLVPLADVHIGQDVGLLGYALSDREVAPGKKLSITLWWKALEGSLDERSILLHLRDSKGEKRAQGDGPPANGGRPTSTWQQGEIVIDNHTLDVPTDLAEGTYYLAVGMYRFPSLEQLPLTRAGKQLEEDVLLVPVQVKR